MCCTQTWEAKAIGMLSLMDHRQGVWSNSVNNSSTGAGSAAGSSAAASSFSGKGPKVWAISSYTNNTLIIGCHARIVFVVVLSCQCNTFAECNCEALCIVHRRLQ